MGYAQRNVHTDESVHQADILHSHRQGHRALTQSPRRRYLGGRAHADTHICQHAEQYAGVHRAAYIRIASVEINTNAQENAPRGTGTYTHIRARFPVCTQTQDECAPHLHRSAHTRAPHAASHMDT